MQIHNQKQIFTLIMNVIAKSFWNNANFHINKSVIEKIFRSYNHFNKIKEMTEWKRVLSENQKDSVIQWCLLRSFSVFLNWEIFGLWETISEAAQRSLFVTQMKQWVWSGSTKGHHLNHLNELFRLVKMNEIIIINWFYFGVLGRYHHKSVINVEWNS